MLFKAIDTTIILALWCALLAGCSTTDSSIPKTLAAQKTFTQRIQQLDLQQRRVEEMAAHWPHRTPDFMKSIKDARLAWAEYLRAEQEQRARMTAAGVAIGSEYYQTQNTLVDAFSRHWDQTEELLKQRHKGAGR